MTMGKTITVSVNDVLVLKAQRQQVDGGSWEVIITEHHNVVSKDRFDSYSAATKHISESLGARIASIA